MAYLHGKNFAVAWTPSGGSSVTLAVTNHTWKEAIEAASVDDTSSSGIQQLLAGFLRGDGTVQGHYNSSQLVFGATIQIRAGYNGVLLHAIGTSTQVYTIPCMIMDVNSVVPHNGVIDFDFNVRLNGLAGTYTYPT